MDKSHKQMDSAVNIVLDWVLDAAERKISYFRLFVKLIKIELAKLLFFFDVLFGL